MQYTVCAVLSVCCTRCSQLIMAWRAREGWVNFMFFGDCRIEAKKERDGATDYETRELRELRVRVNLPSPIWQLPVPIRHVSTPIQGLPNPIKQVIHLIPHVRSDSPHPSHLHHSSFSFSSTTLISSQNTMLSNPSRFLHAMIMY
jgi:hypothetical protein